MIPVKGRGLFYQGSTLELYDMYRISARYLGILG